MTSGIFLTADVFSSLPALVQKQVFAAVFPPSEVEEGASEPATAGVGDDEHFAEFSPGQARQFLTGCQPKTKEVLKAMVGGATRRFKLTEVCKAVGLTPKDLTGVWGGITRRTKTISGDQSAYLVDWQDDAVFDDEGVYAEQSGEISEMSYVSFRKAFKL